MQKTYLARYADHGEYGLESHTCPVDEANGDFLLWSMGKYGAIGKIYKKPSGSNC